MFLSFLSYFFIPAYTLFFVKGYSWVTTNFSVIGNLDRRDAFVLWGILVGYYFFTVMRRLIRCMAKKPKGAFLVPLSLILLLLAVATPYLPQLLPFKSFLHIVFAFMAAICLMVCLYLMVWQLYRENPSVYRPYLWSLGIITFVCAFLLLLIGIVSTVLEIFFTISAAILTRRLLIKAVKLKKPSHGSQHNLFT